MELTQYTWKQMEQEIRSGKILRILSQPNHMLNVAVVASLLLKQSSIEPVFGFFISHNNEPVSLTSVKEDLLRITHTNGVHPELFYNAGLLHKRINHWRTVPDAVLESVLFNTSEYRTEFTLSEKRE